MSKHGTVWRPHKRLRHLQSLQAHNLSGVLDSNDLGGAYFVLWSHLGAEQSSVALSCVYVSETVYGSTSPAWAPLDISNLACQPDLLHGAQSGLLHLHIYSLLPRNPSQSSDVIIQSHEYQRHPDCDDQQQPDRDHQQPDRDPRQKRSCEELHQQLQQQWQGLERDRSLDHALPQADQPARPENQNAHDEGERRQSLSLSDVFKWPGKHRTTNAHTTTKERGALPTSDSAESLQDLEQATHSEPAVPEATRRALACCRGLKLPGKLQLATSVNLASLQRLGPDAQAVAALNLPYPMNTVTFDLGDSIYVQPGLLEVPPAVHTDSSAVHTLEPRDSSGSHAATPAAEGQQGALPGVLRALLWRSTPAVDSGTPHRADDESSQHSATRTAVLPEIHASSPTPTLRFLQSQGAPASPLRLPNHNRSASAGLIPASASFTPPSGMSPQGSAASELSKASLPLHKMLAADSPPDAQEVDVESLLSTVQGLEAVQCRLQEQMQQCSELQKRLDQGLTERQDMRHRHQQLTDARKRAHAQRQLREAMTQNTQQLTKRAAAMQSVLSMQSTALADACKALKAARARLRNAEGLLDGQGRRERWADLQAHMTARRCTLASSLGSLFSLQPQPVLEPCAPSHGFVWDLLEAGWEGRAEGSLEGDFEAAAAHLPLPHPPALQCAARDKGGADRLERLATAWFQGGPNDAGGSEASSTSSNMYRETAMLAVGGLYLPPSLYRDRQDDDSPNPLDSDPEQLRRTASALGYAAHVIVLLGQYLDIPLRYPVRAAVSRSAVLDGAAPAGRTGLLRQHLTSDSGRAMVLLSRSESRLVEAELAATLPPPTEFPLFCNGDANERTRFAYAAFLLNKDVEQLLDAHGLTSSGPSALLANLYKLISAAASGLPSNTRHSGSF